MIAAAWPVVSDGSIVSGWCVIQSPTVVPSTRPGRDGPQHVALGEDPDEPLAVEHECRAHVALVDSLRRLRQRQPGLHAPAARAT